MGYIGFIGVVLIITAFVGLYMFMKGANSDSQPTPETKQPKVYTLDCSACVWRNAETCKECAINNSKEVTHDKLLELKRTMEGRNAVPPPPLVANKADNGFCPTGIECRDCMWRDCC